MAISSGEITALTALGGMWSPFVGLLVMRLVFPDGGRRGSLAGLGCGWGSTRHQLAGLVLPVVYVGATYAVVWLMRVGRLTDLPPATIAKFVAHFTAQGLFLGSVVALGKEVGWQEFLAPELSRAGGVTPAALLRGIIWSV